MERKKKLRCLVRKRSFEKTSCLPHSAPFTKNAVTSELNTIALAFRFSIDAETKIATDEIRIIDKSMEPKTLKLFFYWNEVSIKTDQQSLHPFLKGNGVHNGISARLTSRLDRVLLGDIMVQYTADVSLKNNDNFLKNPAWETR